MSDKAFVDTNIFIYLYSVDENEKCTRASDALERHNCVTSTQALNEFTNFCIKKWKLAPSDILAALEEICTVCAIQYIDEDTVRQALEAHEKYGYSYYDCLNMMYS